MDDLAHFCCQHPDCPRYGQRRAGNLSVCDRFAKGNHRLLYCNACKARFSEFKGTPLFNSKLPHDKVIAVLEHLAEGCGIRRVALVACPPVHDFDQEPGIVKNSGGSPEISGGSGSVAPSGL